MFEENFFLANPMIYFGTHEKIQFEETCYAEAPEIIFSIEMFPVNQSHVGLFMNL